MRPSILKRGEGQPQTKKISFGEEKVIQYDCSNTSNFQVRRDSIEDYRDFFEDITQSNVFETEGGGLEEIRGGGQPQFASPLASGKKTKLDSICYSSEKKKQPWSSGKKNLEPIIEELGETGAEGQDSEIWELKQNF